MRIIIQPKAVNTSVLKFFPNNKGLVRISFRGSDWSNRRPNRERLAQKSLEERKLGMM